MGDTGAAAGAVDEGVKVSSGNEKGEAVMTSPGPGAMNVGSGGVHHPVELPLPYYPANPNPFLAGGGAGQAPPPLMNPVYDRQMGMYPQLQQPQQLLQIGQFGQHGQGSFLLPMPLGYAPVPYNYPQDGGQQPVAFGGLSVEVHGGGATLPMASQPQRGHSTSYNQRGGRGYRGGDQNPPRGKNRPRVGYEGRGRNQRWDRNSYQPQHQQQLPMANYYHDFAGYNYAQDMHYQGHLQQQQQMENLAGNPVVVHTTHGAMCVYPQNAPVAQPQAFGTGEVEQQQTLVSSDQNISVVPNFQHHPVGTILYRPVPIRIENTQDGDNPTLAAEAQFPVAMLDNSLVRTPAVPNSESKPEFQNLDDGKASGDRSTEVTTEQRSRNTANVNVANHSSDITNIPVKQRTAEGADITVEQKPVEIVNANVEQKPVEVTNVTVEKKPIENATTVDQKSTNTARISAAKKLIGNTETTEQHSAGSAEISVNISCEKDPDSKCNTKTSLNNKTTEVPPVLVSTLQDINAPFQQNPFPESPIGPVGKNEAITNIPERLATFQITSSHGKSGSWNSRARNISTLGRGVAAGNARGRHDGSKYYDRGAAQADPASAHVANDNLNKNDTTEGRFGKQIYYASRKPQAASPRFNKGPFVSVNGGGTRNSNTISHVKDTTAATSSNKSVDDFPKLSSNSTNKNSKPSASPLLTDSSSFFKSSSTAPLKSTSYARVASGKHQSTSNNLNADPVRITNGSGISVQMVDKGSGDSAVPGLEERLKSDRKVGIESSVK